MERPADLKVELLILSNWPEQRRRSKRQANGGAGAFIVAMPLVTGPPSTFAVLEFGDLAIDWPVMRLLAVACGAGTALAAGAFAGYRGLGCGNGLAAGALGILTLLAAFFLGFITRFCCAAT